MKLKLKRDLFHPEYTLGKLYIDDVYECETCEDTDRDLENGGKKEEGKTAIPKGEYKVIRDYSNRFQKYMPHILDVPQFEGVRIHAGNSEANTDGCLLVGRKRGTGDFRILESRVVFDELDDKLESALSRGETITLEIC